MHCSGICALVLLSAGSFASAESDLAALSQCLQLPAAARLLAANLTEVYGLSRAPRLHLYGTVRSKAAQRPGEQHVLTIVTVLTAARADTLLAQCLTWPGPLVAALHVSVLHTGHGPFSEAQRQTLDTTLQIANDLANKSRGCQLTVLVLYELVAHKFLLNLFPINSLRNVALLAASTPLVAMIDVDLLISISLGQELVTGSKNEQRSKELQATCERGRLVILPAFQTPRTKADTEGELEVELGIAEAAVIGGKSDLRPLLARGKLIPFASRHFRIGHYRTDFTRWLDANKQYGTTFIAQFEPWVIMPRLHAPFYDVRYRGYGRNKQQQIAHAVLVRNFSMLVHPNAFLVHRPHVKSAAQAGHDFVLGLMGPNVTQAARDKARGEKGDAALSLAHVRHMDAMFFGGVKALTLAANSSRKATSSLVLGSAVKPGPDSSTGVKVRSRAMGGADPSAGALGTHDPVLVRCLETLAWWRGNTVLL